MRLISLLAALMLIAATTTGQNCIIADYPFNGNANDSTGNGYNAVVYGATITQDRFGVASSAYEFDGTNDYIDTETSFDYQERTISIWGKADRLGKIMSLFDMDANSLTFGAIGIKIFSDGTLGVNAGGGFEKLTNTINSGEWYHFVLTRDANEGEFYLNGQLIKKLNVSSSGSSTNPNLDLLIGTSRMLNNYFEGVIDDVKIFDCKLNASEIQAIYGDSNSCSFASFPLDGNGNDTIQGLTATIYGASSDTSRLGNLNGAFHFDGIDDYMDTEESFDFNYRTFSVWAKVDSIGQTMRILEMDAASLNFGAVGITVKDDGTIIANPGGAATIINTITVQPGEWNHYALVRDDDVGKFYFNGQFVTQVTTSGNGSNSFPNPHLLIGTWRSTDSRFFNGSIDDLIIYNCALSDQDIQDIYNASPSGIAQTPLDAKVSVYPNPISVGENLHLSISRQYQNKQLRYHLLDVQGRIVQSGEVISNLIQFSNRLPHGFYVLQLSFDGNRVLNKKVIVR